MAQAHAFRRTAFAVLGATAVTTAALPRRTVWAEAPAKEQLPSKKPIYSQHYVAPVTEPTSSLSIHSKPNPENPTPTDRLQDQIKRARLFLYDQSLSAEHTFNDFLTWAFKKETNFANTIASLAPKPETGEQLLPGAIYVLVATMTGSIVARNRNILIRATFPVVVGVTAGWMLIPHTMRNTADLIWEYEKKAPVVADAHLSIRKVALDLWQQTRKQTEEVRKWGDQTATQTRAKLEGLVEGKK